MKYEVFQITCGEETSILKTNDIQAAKKAYNRIFARQGCVRLRVGKRTLPIHEADKLLKGGPLPMVVDFKTKGMYPYTYMG